MADFVMDDILVTLKCVWVTMHRTVHPQVHIIIIHFFVGVEEQPELEGSFFWRLKMPHREGRSKELLQFKVGSPARNNKD